MDKPNPDYLPIGSIAPFFRDKVPVGWVTLDGRRLSKHDCYEFWDAIYYGENALIDIWKKHLGGNVDAGSVTLPNVQGANKAWELTYNMKVEGVDLPDMVLAVKIERAKIKRDASGPS